MDSLKAAPSDHLDSMAHAAAPSHEDAHALAAAPPAAGAALKDVAVAV